MYHADGVLHRIVHGRDVRLNHDRFAAATPKGDGSRRRGDRYGSGSVTVWPAPTLTVKRKSVSTMLEARAVQRTCLGVAASAGACFAVRMSKTDEFRARYGAWALVAGAGEGIGAAYAEALARRGLHLVLVDRATEPLGSLATRLRQAHGVAVEDIVADLAGDDVVERIAAVAGGKEIGLLVCNAAQSATSEYLDVAVDDHRRSVMVNCLAPALLVRRYGALMRGRRRGGIILMSSLSGFQGGPFLAHYAATKAYNLVLAEGLWEECRAYGVDVLAVCPGATRTPGYLAARPKTASRWSPPEMEPSAVVDEALAALGRAPWVIPGRGNRLGAFLIRRGLSRVQAVKAMGRVGRRLVDARRDRPEA